MKPAPCSLAGTMSGICAPAVPGLLGVIEEYGVVGGQDGAAAVAENRGDALIRQHLHDHLGAGHFLTGKRMAGGAGLDDRVAHGSAAERRWTTGGLARD